MVRVCILLVALAPCVLMRPLLQVPADNGPMALEMLSRILGLKVTMKAE